jgi:hypothetical protein
VLKTITVILRIKAKEYIYTTRKYHDYHDVVAAQSPFAKLKNPSSFIRHKIK